MGTVSDKGASLPLLLSRGSVADVDLSIEAVPKPMVSDFCAARAPNPDGALASAPNPIGPPPDPLDPKIGAFFSISDNLGAAGPLSAKLPNEKDPGTAVESPNDGAAVCDPNADTTDDAPRALGAPKVKPVDAADGAPNVGGVCPEPNPELPPPKLV